MDTTDLNAKRLRDLLRYDPDSGHFWWLGKRRGAPKCRPAGAINSGGYVVMSVDKRLYLAHRLAWLHTHGEWPTGVIDHINGIASDNRISNLRDTTQSVNRQNIRIAVCGSKSGKLGVHWDTARGRWMAIIYASKKRIFLGRFDNIDAAHAAYIEVKRQLHPGCTI